MEIKKVALIGAGAIGSYLIWGLSRLADLSFTVIADGQRGERLREKGLVINGEPFRPMVQGAEETGPCRPYFCDRQIWGAFCHFTGRNRSYRFAYHDHKPHEWGGQ